MKPLAPALLALCAFLVSLAIGCDDEKKPAAPLPSAAPPVSAVASATASTPTPPASAASAAPASSKDPDIGDPDDADDDRFAGDITADTFEREMDSLDKQVSTKY